MSSQNSSKESSRIDFEDTELSDLVAHDILTAKNDLEKTIDDIKGSINLLFSYVRSYEMKSDSLHPLKKIHKGKRLVKAGLSDIIDKIVEELHRKATLDLRFVQLYDKYLAEELSFKIKDQGVEKQIGLVKNRLVEDFQKLNKEAERTVELTTSKLQEYLGIKAKENQRNPTNIDTGVLMKFKEKALNDLHNTKIQAEKDIYRTKMRINDNIGIFLTNPNGPKTREEIESEKFITDQILTMKETVARDLRASKDITDKIATRTKQAIENFSMAENDTAHVEYKGLNFTFEKFQDKTAQDFKDVNTDMGEKVTDIKEKFQNTIDDVNLAITTSGHNKPKMLPNSSQPRENVPSSPKEHIERIKNDFHAIDGKMKEDTEDIKVGIADMVCCAKQKLEKE